MTTPMSMRPQSSMATPGNLGSRIISSQSNWTPAQRPQSYNFNSGATPTSASMQQSVQSERIISSSIIGETTIGPSPQEDNVQFVEVPVVEEVVKHVPKKEYVEVEKRVPKYHYEWVERLVEVPQVHFVDKTVEVPEVQEVVRHVPIKQVVEVPREVTRRVPKIETKIVEREVEVPGEVIEVPKKYLVENKIVVPRYTDREVPTVVAQRLVPIITESETDDLDIDLREYNPYLVPVDVYVPRPVSRQLIAASKVQEHRVVDVPVAQFNTLLKQLNGHIQDNDLQELLVKDRRGGIPMMPLTAGSLVTPPVENDWLSEHVEGTAHYCHEAPVQSITTTTTTNTATMGTSGVLTTSGHQLNAASAYSTTGPNRYYTSQAGIPGGGSSSQTTTMHSRTAYTQSYPTTSMPVSTQNYAPMSVQTTPYYYPVHAM